MNCADCQDSLMAYLDHELPEEQQRGVGSHLAGCADCRRELEDVERFARRIHNATIPFRHAVASVGKAAAASAMDESRASEEIRAPLRGEIKRRPLPVWDVLAFLAVMALGYLIVRAPGADPDRLAAWAVRHFELVDQVHPVRGDAEAVRSWFKEHHHADVAPPHDADYAALSGCKMIEQGSLQIPLLRFDGPEITGVFILPAAWLEGDGAGTRQEYNRDGYGITVWREGGTAYLSIRRTAVDASRRRPIL